MSKSVKAFLGSQWREALRSKMINDTCSFHNDNDKKTVKFKKNLIDIKCPDSNCSCTKVTLL